MPTARPSVAASASSSIAWLHELSPWTNALRGNLLLSLDTVAPLYSDVLEQLWIQFQVPSVETWALDNSLVWLEALQLLDVFAAVDRRACWEMMFDLCDGDARAKLRALGCPLEFVVAMRPRYELRYDCNATPSAETMTYMLEDNPWCSATPHPGVRCERNRTLLDMVRNARGRAPASPPILLRINFVCGGDEAYSCLTRVLKSACRVAAVRDAALASRRFEVASLALNLQAMSTRHSANEVVGQIACHMPLHKATISYATDPSLRNLYGSFLWRLLAPHDEARTFCGLRNLTVVADVARPYDVQRYAAADQIIALCAAVHSSKTLDELALTCVGDGESWCPWFALALFSPTAQHQIHTVHLTLGRSFRRFVDAIKRSVGPGNDTSTQPLIPWPPEVVRVDAQTKILGFELPVGTDANTVYHGTRSVDCLVRGHDDANFVRVVLPGIGIGCVDRKDVLSQTPARLRPMHSIRKLTLVIQCMRWTDYPRNVHMPAFDAVSVVELLRAIGVPLLDLTLSCVGERSREVFDMDGILVSCPRLHSLKLVRMTLSSKQIFTAVHGYALESLTFDDCEIWNYAQRPHDPIGIASTVFPRLTSLCVTTTGYHIHDYVLAFAMQRSLHRLVVMFLDPKKREQYAAYMAQHDGTPIPSLPLREKLAFLSVGCPSHMLSIETVALIFEMASTAMRRRVYTFLP